MVTRAYLEQQPRAPSRAKQMVNQTVFPILINSAAMVEQGLGRLSAGVRGAPVAALTACAGLGWLIAAGLARKKHQ